MCTVAKGKPFEGFGCHGNGIATPIVVSVDCLLHEIRQLGICLITIFGEHVETINVTKGKSFKGLISRNYQFFSSFFLLVGAFICKPPKFLPLYLFT